MTVIKIGVLLCVIYIIVSVVAANHAQEVHEQLKFVADIGLGLGSLILFCTAKD